VNHDLLNLEQPVRSGVRDRVLALRSQPMFEGLDDDGVLLLVEHARSVTYREGQVICEEGRPSRAVFLVIAGAIVVSAEGRVISVREPGDAYGALPLLAAQNAPLAVARGTTTLVEVPAAAFEAALVENYSLLRNTLRVLGSGVLAVRGNLPGNPENPRPVDEGTYYEQPQSMVERLIQLRQSPFGRMNMDALVDFARYMEEVRYAAGEPLWSIGEPSTHALHLDVGRIRCTGADGRQVDIGKGFTIGTLDVWGRQRVYDARAVTPLIAFRIEFENFQSLLETHPDVGLELLRGFARDLLSAQQAK